MSQLLINDDFIGIEDRSFENAILDSLLNEMQCNTSTSIMNFHGKDFFIFQNVFSPLVFSGVGFLFDNILRRINGSFLEIGSGAGIVTTLAALMSNQKIVATDISPFAIENTYKNAMLHGVLDRIQAKVGDVFSPLEEGECFDTIFWHLPYGYTKETSLSRVERSIYDFEYQGLYTVLSEGSRFLSSDGKLFLGFSPSHGHLDILEKWAQSFGWEMRMVDKGLLEYGDILLGLYELKREE